MEMDEKLTIAATEAGGHYGNLSLTLVWGPEGALLVVEVLCTMEDDCVVGGESDGRHCEWAGEAGIGGAAYGKKRGVEGGLYSVESLVRRTF